jgi:hypothetical protein
VHAGISVCALKSCTNIWCWIFSLARNTVTLHCQTTCPHRPFCHTEMWPHDRGWWCDFHSSVGL